jgi:hypothetical protein
VSISMREISLSCRQGVDKISLHKFRVKTRLPAPIRVILGIGIDGRKSMVDIWS